jgi:WD40 repeat protein
VPSPDGTLVAAAGDDWTVWLWQVTTGTEHAVLTSHTKWMTHCAFSPEALVTAAASWLAEPNGEEQLAYALLGTACMGDVTAEHVYLALITPPDNSDDHFEACLHSGQSFRASSPVKVRGVPRSRQGREATFAGRDRP